MKDSKDLIAGGVEIKKWFFREYGENSVQVTVPAEDLQRERETTMPIILIILFLALAGLFTAGVNVSNILYTRAIRRQKVVGILMALGSSRRNIFMLFYSEAMALSAAGTLLGALIAVGLLPFLGSITGQEGFNALFLVLSILSAGIIILTMILFPALTASKLPPADAIRAD
jgi:putative ABC transport system permease protein